MLGQASGFLHPGMAAAGAAAMLIPLAVHLLNRRRHRRMPWAAMAFLLAASRQSRRRIFLEQWVLLLIRAAAVAALGLAAARPFLASQTFAISGAARAHRILLLDDTLSTQARVAQGTARFDGLKRQAEDLVRAFPPGDVVSLVTLTAADDPVRLAEAVDRRAALDRLSMLSPSFGAADLAAAVDVVRSLIGRSSVIPSNQSVYLLGDLAASDWLAGGQPTPGALAAAQLSTQHDLTVFAGSDESLPNGAVTRLSMDTPLVGVNFPARFEVEVANFGGRALRGATVQITQRDRIIHQVELPPIEPGGRGVEQGVVMFTEAGVHGLAATLSAPLDNALAPDDRRYLSVQARNNVALLLVDGRPGATRMEGQAGYLSTALAPQTERSEPGLFDPKVVTDLELASEVLADFDLVALCNVHRLTDELWTRLADFVASGGALLVFGGDLVSADNYNRHAMTASTMLLPGRIGGTVNAAEGQQAWTRLKLTDPPHPLTADFARTPESGLFVARVEKYLAFEPDRHAQTVLRYGTSDPAVVIARGPQGACAFVSTTANMDWNNLAGKGDYVSLMIALVSSILPQRDVHRNVAFGENIAEPLRPGQASLTVQVTSPSGAALRATLLQSGIGDRLTCAAGPMREPGLAHMQIGAQGIPFAVNVSPRESDLRAIGADRLKEILGPRARIIRKPDSTEPPAAVARASDLGGTALLVVLVLILVEMTLAAALGGGRPRNGSAPP